MKTSVVKKIFHAGYQKAMKDLNIPMKMIVKEWNPSECPRCHELFDEECYDGYYKRSYALERCPYCGQKIEW